MNIRLFCGAPAIVLLGLAIAPRAVLLRASEATDLLLSKAHSLRVAAVLILPLKPSNKC